MTNGEKIKELFSDTKIITQFDNPFGDRFMVFTLNNESRQVNIDWWNAEYKEPTTKNDLAVDYISRADAIQAMQDKAKKLTNEDTINGLCGAVAILFELPSVTPQEPQTFKWCTDCKEYDQEKHCCHRWSKVIRDTVEEMKQEQEPFINKLCVSSGVCEHDKNEVLDKIRAEIEAKYGHCDICEYFEDYDYEENDISEYRPIGNIADILQIIDKYKAESEVEDGKI